ncbi:MAG: C25 family cysteine peptidase [Planctomycetota bacterium]
MKAALWSALLVGLLVSPAAAEKHDVIWLAVGPEELTAPLAPLIEKRKADGYVVHVAKPPVADAIKALGRAPSVLLLVGDVHHGHPAESWTVPPMRRELYKWRKPQRPEFSSDALYGDTDGDLVPDIPVGRIPARTPAQVKLVVEKTLTYEKQVPTLDDLRIVAWAGAPGYGGTIDAMATGMLVSTVRRFAPAWSDRWLISAAAGNELCGWPPDQPRLFNEQWKKGAVLAAFVAHASDQAVFSMRHEGKGVWYHPGSARTAFATASKVAAPVLFLTCYSGEFDDGNECLGETLLFLPGGPPAVIAATTESHPLPNVFAGRAMLKEMSGGAMRLGRTWTHAQKKAVGMKDFLMENLLKDVEGKLEAEIDVAKLRRDHPLMFAILGDPALRLKTPLPLDVKIEPEGDNAWTWSVPKPQAPAKLTVGYRAIPKSGKPPAGTAVPDRETANRRLVEANAKEAYVTVATLAADAEWTGALTKPGWYRFVVEGGERLAATAVKVGK